MIDTLEAMRQILLGDPTLTDLVENRVYAELLIVSAEESEAEKPQPRPTVVVKEAPGPERTKLVIEPRVDILCFAPTEEEAGALDRIVTDILRTIHRKVVATANGFAFVHNVACSSGRSFLRDPATGWPFSRRAAVVRIDRRELTAAEALP